MTKVRKVPRVFKVPGVPKVKKVPRVFKVPGVPKVLILPQTLSTPNSKYSKLLSKGYPEGQIESDFCEIHLVKAYKNSDVGRIKELQQSISGFDMIRI